MLCHKCCHPNISQLREKAWNPSSKAFVALKNANWIKLYLAIWGISQNFYIQEVLKFTILHTISGYLEAHIFLTKGWLPVVSWLLLSLNYVVSYHKQKSKQGENVAYSKATDNWLANLLRKRKIGQFLKICYDA